MRNIIKLHITTIIFLFGVSSARADFTFFHNHHTYLLISSGKKWDQAWTNAVSRGGTLARIDNATENNAILTNLLNRGISTRAGDGGGSIYVWIGGKETVEGTYAWTAADGSPTTFWTNGSAGSAFDGLYVNFARNATSDGGPEPDNYAGIQNRAAMCLESWPNGSSTPIGVAGEWNDISSNNSLAHLVEFSPPTTPTNITSTVTDTNLTINWPGNYIGWVLQMQTNSLATGLLTDSNAWYNLSGTEITNSYSVPLLSAEGGMFFRLALP